MGRSNPAFTDMAKYIVDKPWSFTVKAGDTFETDDLHPSLVPHVRKMPEETDKTMQVATPKRARQSKKDDE